MLKPIDCNCTSCGKYQEVWTDRQPIPKIGESLDVECVECLQHTVVRRPNKMSFELKGSGWYANDNKGK